MKIQRNDPCFCGSDKKYKKCCLLNKKETFFRRSPKALHNVEFDLELIPEAEELCYEALDYMEKGNQKEANEIIEQLIEDYYDYYLAQFVMAVDLAKKECFSVAIEYFNRAIQHYPFFIEAYFNLANAYRKEANIKEAVGCFKKVIEIDSKLEGLGKDAVRELEWLEKGTRENTGCSLYEYLKGEDLYNDAVACIDQKKFKEAIALFEQVLMIQRDHVQSHGNMGMIYMQLGKRERALECLDKALSLDPNYGPALHNKIVALSLSDGDPVPSEIEIVNYYKEKMYE